MFLLLLGEKSLKCFNINNKKHGFLKYINKTDIDDLVENNKITISVYLCVVYNKKLGIILIFLIILNIILLNK